MKDSIKETISLLKKKRKERTVSYDCNYKMPWCLVEIDQGIPPSSSCYRQGMSVYYYPFVDG